MSRCKAADKIGDVHIIVTASRQVPLWQWHSKCVSRISVPFEIKFESRTNTRMKVRWSSKINGDPPRVHFVGQPPAVDPHELPPTEWCVLHEWLERWPVSNLILMREEHCVGNQWQEIAVKVEVFDTTLGIYKSGTLRIEVKLL